MKTIMYIDKMSVHHINKETGKVEIKGSRSGTEGINATTVRLFTDDIPILVNLEDSTRNTRAVDPFNDYEFTLYWLPEGTEVKLNG